MAAIQITLVIDRQNRILVQSGASVAQLPDLSQRDSIPILVQIADPSTNPLNGQPTILTSSDISSGAPRVTVAQKATADAGDENTWLLAKLREDDFIWDAAQKGFTATLDLNTLQLQTFMVAQGTEYVTVEFEVRFSAGGSLCTILPGPKNKFKIYANDDEGSDPAVDILDGVPTFTLPLQFKDPASGELYVLSRTAPGTLSFDIIP